MELYGTPLDDDEGERREVLRDVTIIATADSLRHLAKFLDQAADDIDEYGHDFEHDHYELFAGRDLGQKPWGGDVTVLHPRYAARDDLGDAFLATLPSLVRAAMLGDDAAVSELLANGHDAKQTDGDGFTALQAACKAGSARIVERLLSAGADVNAGAYGRSPLMIAAGEGSPEIFEILLAAGADIHAKSEHLDTALDEAAGCGHAEILKRLIELGADVEGGDDELTALTNAAELGQLETVRLLLGAGANPFRTYEGETPLDLARKRGHTEVAELLQRVMHEDGSADTVR